MSGSRSRRAAALLVLGLLAVAVYAPGLGGPAVLDDRHNLAPLADIATGRMAAADYLLAPGAGGLPRPVSKASFLVNWWTSGDRLTAYKLTNLILHLSCGGLVYLLSVRVLGARAGGGTGEETGDGPHHALALFVTAAWLLSPMLVSTVLYVVQRMAQLATLFSLACVLCYLQARHATGARRAAGLSLSGVAGLLALGSKQNAIVLPALLLLAEFYLFTGASASPRARRILGSVCAAGALTLTATLIASPGWLLDGYTVRDFDLGERLLTQPRVLAHYAGNLLLLPFAQPMGLFHDDLLPSRGLLHPPSTLAALLGLAAVSVVSLRLRRGPLAVTGFGCLFFILAHAVESGPFPLELYFEHRNYLPAVGLFMALAGLTGCRLGSRRLWSTVMILMVLASAALSAGRVMLWRSEASLYASAVARHPASARARLGLAAMYFNAGDEASARSALDAASALLPASARFGIALNALAGYCVTGRPAPHWVRQRLDDATLVGNDFYTINAMGWLSGAVAAGACTDVDVEHLRRRISDLSRQAPRASTRERGQARELQLRRLMKALRARR